MTDQARTPLPKPTFTLLRALQADSMLEGTPILPRIDQIHQSMDYPLRPGMAPMSPIEALHELQKMAADVPQVRLRQSISPGEENGYHVDLTLSYEQVLNRNQHVFVLATAFLGHLKAVHTRITHIGPVFNLWWTVGAKEILEGSGNKNLLTEKNYGVLATDEFSEAMGGKDIEVGAVMDATALLITQIKANLKQADLTYQLGRDQINVALADGRVPNTAINPTAPRSLAQPQPAAIDTLRSTFGDRVRPVEPPPPSTLNEDEDLGLVNLADSRASVEDEPEAPAEEAASEPDVDPIPEPTPEPIPEVQPEPTPEPSIEAPVLPTPVVEPEQPKAERKPGEPLVVTTSLNVQAPGISGRYEGVILGRGKSKLNLTAQADPSENGIYRYMGPDQPLALLDADGKPVTKDEKTEQAAQAQPEAAPVQEERKIVTTVVVTDDPFAQVKVTGPVHPEVPASASSTGPVGLEDEDFATVAVAAPAPVIPATVSMAVTDEDELFANITAVADNTPASKELAEGADPFTDPAPAVTKVEAPKVEAPKVEAPKVAPAAPAATGSPFRSRAAAPGTAVGKPFTPPAAARSAQPPVSTAGLDEVL